MAADGKTPPTHPQGGGGNIMCTCSIFVCRHKNNDMSTLLGHAHTYIPTDRQTDTQAYIHKSIQTYSYTYTWLHMCDVSPLWGGGGVGGEPGGWIIYMWKKLKKYMSKICHSTQSSFFWKRREGVPRWITSSRLFGKNVQKLDFTLAFWPPGRRVHDSWPKQRCRRFPLRREIHFQENCQQKLMVQ